MSLCLPGAAAAQRSPVVVELFTSQGCSSCPPADLILADLAQLPGVIALALHVDYWDYLGWRDTFGRPESTKRQRAYAKAVRERSVYTPQIIVQGVDRIVGGDRDLIMARIAEHQARPAPVALDLEREDTVLNISLRPTELAGVGPSEIYVVRFIAGETVSIEHGENAGHVIPYVNVVTEWSSLGQWDGRTPARFAVDLLGPENVAVILQRDLFGPVITAATLR